MYTPVRTMEEQTARIKLFKTYIEANKEGISYNQKTLPDIEDISYLLNQLSCSRVPDSINGKDTYYYSGFYSDLNSIFDHIRNDTSNRNKSFHISLLGNSYIHKYSRLSTYLDLGILVEDTLSDSPYVEYTVGPKFYNYFFLVTALKKETGLKKLTKSLVSWFEYMNDKKDIPVSRRSFSKDILDNEYTNLIQKGIIDRVNKKGSRNQLVMTTVKFNKVYKIIRDLVSLFESNID